MLMEESGEFKPYNKAKCMTKMKGERRRTRELAFKALYEIDSAKHKPDAVIDRILAEEKPSEKNASFFRELVNGVIEHKKEIDRRISSFAPAFPLEQISVVDRNILRLAIFEILLDNKTPVKVAIDEAVELAKVFGSEKASRFVNGVLGSISALATQSEQKGSLKEG